MTDHDKDKWLWGLGGSLAGIIFFFILFLVMKFARRNA